MKSSTRSKTASHGWVATPEAHPPHFACSTASLSCAPRCRMCATCATTLTRPTSERYVCGVCPGNARRPLNWAALLAVRGQPQAAVGLVSQVHPRPRGVPDTNMPDSICNKTETSQEFQPSGPGQKTITIGAFARDILLDQVRCVSSNALTHPTTVLFRDHLPTHPQARARRHGAATASGRLPDQASGQRGAGRPRPSRHRRRLQATCLGQGLAVGRNGAAGAQPRRCQGGGAGAGVESAAGCIAQA